MTETEHPEWVYERAAVLMNEQGGRRWTADGVRYSFMISPSVKALLALIAKHEPEPVDPLDAEVERLYLEWLSVGGAKATIRKSLQRGGEIVREGRS